MGKKVFFLARKLYIIKQIVVNLFCVFILIFSCFYSGYAGTCNIERLDSSVNAGSNYGYSQANASQGNNTSLYGFTSGAQFAASFDYGAVWGRAICKSVVGKWAEIKNFGTGDHQGNYCWCQVTGFSSPRDSYASGPECTVSPSHYWLVYGTASDSTCKNTCSINCAKFLYNSSSIRESLFRATLGAAPEQGSFNVAYACGIGFGTAPIDSNNYEFGANVIMATNTCTPAEGNVFHHWDCGGNDVYAGSSLPITGNIACTAQYIPASTINLTWDGEGTPVSCSYGETFVPPTPEARTGMVFTGWKITDIRTICGIENLDSSINGIKYGYRNAGADTGNNIATYGLQKGWFAVEFDYGVVWGRGGCINRSGTWGEAQDLNGVGSSTSFCWCQVNGFSPPRDSYASGPECTVAPSSSWWVYYTKNSSTCKNVCMNACASTLQSNANYRRTLFEIAGKQ